MSFLGKIIRFATINVVGPFSVWHFLFMSIVIYLWMGASKKSVHVSHILLENAALARNLKAQLEKVDTTEDMKDLFYMIAKETSICPSGKSMGEILEFLAQGKWCLRLTRYAGKHLSTRFKALFKHSLAIT